jgi:argininosuccinate lyase
MPHKKNPDVWEIMRGKCNMIMSTEGTVSMMCSNMPHGYHREFQLLKDVLFPALELMHNCLEMADYMLQHISVKENILDAPIYDYLFTVEEVNRRTLNGMPFRDAYKTVGIEVNEGIFHYQGAEGKTNGQLSPADLNHTSIGSLGNLCTEAIKTKMQKAAEF